MTTDFCNIYHTEAKTTKKLLKCAYPGILESIKFEQWHISHELRSLTSSLKLIEFASLLAVFPRLGMCSLEIPHSMLAEKMAELFHCPVPSRQTISKWEHKLSDMGFLEIPRHVDWRNSKTKIRVFTEKFWNMSRRGMPKLSYTGLHAPECCGKYERVKQDTPKENFCIVNSESDKRARVNNAAGQRTLKQHTEPEPRAKTRKKINTQKKRRFEKLKCFENSIRHWIFRAGLSTREAFILLGRFFDMGAQDEYYCRLQRAWTQCGDIERPGLVRDLILYLRSVPGIEPIPESVLTDAPADGVITPSDDGLSDLRAAIFFNADYNGKHVKLVELFRNGTPEIQDEIVKRLNRITEKNQRIF